MPDWYFLAHQTMTDMPFVASMTACMGLVMIGLRTPEALEARAYEVKVKNLRFRLTAWHLVFGAVLICVAPADPLSLLAQPRVSVATRRPRLPPPLGRVPERLGGGNCGLPGNEDCRITQPASVPHAAAGNPDSLGAMACALLRRVRAGPAGAALGGGARRRSST